MCAPFTVSKYDYNVALERIAELEAADRRGGEMIRMFEAERERMNKLSRDASKKIEDLKDLLVRVHLILLMPEYCPVCGLHGELGHLSGCDLESTLGRIDEALDL